MTGKSSAYFQELTDRERESKLSLVSRLGATITLWEKGSTSRESHTVKEFRKEEGRLLCIPPAKSALKGKKVLYTFELNGLAFFGNGETKLLGSGMFSLELAPKLFKNERRTTFRLLTFPHHKVFLHIKLNEEELQQSNVVGIKSGMSETGLFKNFLKLVKGKEEGIYREGYSPLRVLDISVTGAAIQVGELEAGAFLKGAETGEILLEFNGHEETIPGGEVVYNVDMVPALQGQKMFKVGIKFLNLTEVLDQKLGKLINTALRDFETEFEDFIK